MTIVELLVSIGVIGAIVAITFPALMGSRVSSLQIQSVSNSRDIAADMQAYADAFGRWPFARAGEPLPGELGQHFDRSDFPPDALIVPWWPSPLHMGGLNHWSLDRLWPGVVAVAAPWEEHYDTWVSPGRDFPSLFTDDGRPAATIVTSYIYANSFIASPALWSGSASADESLIAPTRPSDVAFPANKVLVWDGDLAYLPRPPRRLDGHWFHPTPMAFADGHAAIHTPHDAAPGVANPLNNNSSTRLHNTPDGVLGRDY